MKRIAIFLSMIVFAGLLMSGCAIFLGTDGGGEYYYEKFQIDKYDFDRIDEPLLPNFREIKEYRDDLKKEAVGTKVTIGRDVSKNDLLRIMIKGGCGATEASANLLFFPAARNQVFHYKYDWDYGLYEILYVERM